MLWSIFLPIEITFVFLAVLVIIATAMAPKFHRKRNSTFFVSVFLAFVAFIPTCAGIWSLVDMQRFGVFEYNTFDDINDWRVERYLPPAATKITLEKNMQGFRARFSISETDLMSYLDHLWIQSENESPTTIRNDSEPSSASDLEEQTLNFGVLGWPPLEEAVLHYSPTKSNGAGFSVWFSSGKKLAYLRAGYW